MAKYFQLISLWLMIFLSGCVVGPNFQKPAPLKIKSYTQKPISQTAQAPIQAGKSQHFEKGRDIRLTRGIRGLTQIFNLVGLKAIEGIRIQIGVLVLIG